MESDSFKELLLRKYGGEWVSFADRPPMRGEEVAIIYRSNQEPHVTGLTYGGWGLGNFDFNRLYPLEWLSLEGGILPLEGTEALIADLKHEVSFWKARFYEANEDFLEQLKVLRKKYKDGVADNGTECIEEEGDGGSRPSGRGDGIPVGQAGGAEGLRKEARQHT